jgi:hypothetical protein
LAYAPVRFLAYPFGTVCGCLSGRPLLRRKAQNKFGAEILPVLFGKTNKDTTEVSRNISFSTVLGNPNLVIGTMLASTLGALLRLAVQILTTGARSDVSVSVRMRNFEPPIISSYIDRDAENEKDK